MIITHLLLMKSECKKLRLDRVSAKLATSLLRNCNEICADKAFFDAGHANRAVNQINMAFIFFNRYIDLYDVIIDPENEMIYDNTEFEDTDIPPP